MATNAPTAPEHVLIVGGTGRTGRRLVRHLLDDGFEVTAVVRDLDKAQLTIGNESEHPHLNIVQGDLEDVEPWAHALQGVSQVVTAVSCGVSTDPLVVLGARNSPKPLPHQVDGDGIEMLANKAKEHGVRRFVAVTTASAGNAWSPAAILLNTIHSFSVREKWRGEQAIRRSGLDYIILRPYGLGHDVTPAELGFPAARGIGWSQDGRPAGASRRIPRDDVAKLCHEALLVPPGEAPRSTVECWATNEHVESMPWGSLKPDPGGALPEVDHTTAVLVSLGGLSLVGGGVLHCAWRAGRVAMRWLRR